MYQVKVIGWLLLLLTYRLTICSIDETKLTTDSYEDTFLYVPRNGRFDDCLCIGTFAMRIETRHFGP